MTETVLNVSDEVEVTEDNDEPLKDSDLLTEIVMALVSHPGEVFVESDETSQGTLRYVIYVDPRDIGRVIGKSGETISILRKLLGRIAASRNQLIAIDVYDPRKAGTDPKSKTRAA